MKILKLFNKVIKNREMSLLIILVISLLFNSFIVIFLKMEKPYFHIFMMTFCVFLLYISMSLHFAVNEIKNSEVIIDPNVNKTNTFFY